MSYVVDLEAFHGPLDLLLFLLEKNEIDIYDIPVAVITEQYLKYLRETKELHLEQLSSFLVMASYLLNLKSKMLLPRREVETEDMAASEENDPRYELVQQLLDYKKYKELAELLASRQDTSLPHIFYRENRLESEIEPQEQVTASISALFKAYQSVIKNKLKEQFSVPQSDFSVKDKIEEIIALLRNKRGGLVFQELFARTVNRREALVMFLALLELIRLQQVRAMQENPFLEIKIRLCTDNDVNA